MLIVIGVAVVGLFTSAHAPNVRSGGTSYEPILASFSMIMITFSTGVLVALMIAAARLSFWIFADKKPLFGWLLMFVTLGVLGTVYAYPFTR